jgi:hypothetical protein
MRSVSAAIPVRFATTRIDAPASASSPADTIGAVGVGVAANLGGVGVTAGEGFGAGGARFDILESSVFDKFRSMP